MAFFFFKDLDNLINEMIFTQSVLLLTEDSCQASKPIVRSQAVAIANGTFVCDSMKLQTDALTDSKKK